MPKAQRTLRQSSHFQIVAPIRFDRFTAQEVVERLACDTDQLY
jgi:hypothetical protein